MNPRRVLLAANMEQGEHLRRENCEGMYVSEVIVADGAAAVPGFERAFAVLERCRRKTVGR